MHTPLSAAIFYFVEPSAVLQRSRQTPQYMRWALRQPALAATSSSRPSTGSANAPTSGGGGLIYLEPSGMRRSTAASMNSALSAAAAAQTTAVAVAQQLNEESNNAQSVSCTANNLSRAFGIILRQVDTRYVTCYLYSSTIRLIVMADNGWERQPRSRHLTPA